MNKLSIDQNQQQGDLELRPTYDLVNVGRKNRFWANGKLIHNSGGLNVQNLSSGRKKGQSKALKQSITAPDGHVVVVADSSQIEARVLAYLANDLPYLQVFIDGKDPYSVLASQIYGGDPDEIKRLAKADVEPYSNIQRPAGKAGILGCLGKDNLVLCKRGWVKITDVSLDDLVWNGIDYVHHTGVVYQGELFCNELGMTDDHNIFDGVGWQQSQHVNIQVAMTYAVQHLPSNVKTGRVAVGDVKDGIQPTYDVTNVAGNNTYFIKNTNGQIFAVHNCGFGTGKVKFKDYAKTMGVELTMEESEKVVNVFRQSHPAIVAFWKKCDWVLGQLVAGGSGYFGGLNDDTFYYDGSRRIHGDVVPGIRLPDGNWLNYYKLALRPKTMPDGSVKMNYSYYGLKEGRIQEIFTFGARIVENLVQSFAFAIMKWQAMNVNKHYKIVLNTHDEWGVVVPEEIAPQVLEYLIWNMRQVPSWATGLPLDAEGAFDKRYGDCK